MTKYLERSFNSPANNKNYSDNYDRIFGKKEEPEVNEFEEALQESLQAGAELTRQIIMNKASDMMSNFLYYDRKEDEELGVGDIEYAIQRGVVSIEEDLIALFREILEVACAEELPDGG